MPEPIWYRSLYWRIAFGFVALVATLLVLQGGVFLWMTGYMTDMFPSRSPAQLAAAIANDVSTALVDQPGTDLNGYVNGRYSRYSRGFVIVMADGRTVVSERVPPPSTLVRAARGRLFFNGDRRFDGRGGPPPSGDGGPRPRGPGRAGDSFGRGGDSFPNGGDRGFRGGGGSGERRRR